MRHILKLAVLAAPFLMSACSTSMGSSGSTGSTGATTMAATNFPPIVAGATYQADTTRDASFGDLINSVRADNGVTALTYDARLDGAAQAHADDMLANDYFSHTGLDGSTVGERVTAQGYVWSYVGENLGKGQTSEQQVLNGWVGSPGHHANNINPNFKNFGLGRAGTGGDTRWVLVFAAPPGS